MEDLYGTAHRRCCVPGCIYSKKVPFSFHKFPLAGSVIELRDSNGKINFANRCELWKERIGITDINSHTVVCSSHFTEDDYYYSDGSSKFKRLKKSAVPSVNLNYVKTNFTEDELKIESDIGFGGKSAEFESSEIEEVVEYPEDVKEILQEPSDEVFHQAIMELKEPILIRYILRKMNGENIWELLNWNIETIASKFGNTSLPFRVGYKAKTSHPQWEVESQIEWLTMQEFLTKDDYMFWYYFDYKYMHEWCKSSPEILKSFNWNRFGFNMNAEDSTIWIGNAGAHTNCHQDSYGCNLVAQIHGKKEWILLPPEAVDKLKPVRVPYEESTIYSSLNFFTPSEQDKEIIKSISGVKTVILEPGDVLFVPSGWWHYVESLNLTVSVNVWLPLLEDSKSRLKEALVKLVVIGIGENIPSSLENTKCSIAECINYVKLSIDEFQNSRKTLKDTSEINNKEILSVDSLAKNYPLYVFSLKDLDSEELEKLCISKKERFTASIVVPKVGSDVEEKSIISNQLLVAKIVNGFCDTDVIEKVANFLLKDSAQSHNKE